MSSKLLQQYTDLKNKDASSIYLFRVGIFYNILNEDATFIHEKLGLKITPLGTNIFKCGFPISHIEKYITLLEKMEIKYQIINNLPSNTNINNYVNDIEIKKILNTIKSLDMGNTTFHQSFDILLDIQKKLKNIIS